MQVLGKSSVLSRAAPKVPLPFNLPSMRKESAVEASSETDKDGKDKSPQKLEVSRQEQPNSYATVAASRMKPHSVRYSPTMSGKTALETEEHLKDMHETSAGQSASQVETQRTDWNAEAQQKDFPFLNQKSPKMFSSDSKETFPTKETRGNVIESEKLGQSEVLETRNDSKGAVHEHRSVSSVENETFSDSGRESEKPPKRLILRRQEESINRKPESQSWNVESNSCQRDSVYLSAEEPLYESDTVSQDRQKESTKSSGHSGFSSDRDSNDRQSE